jgi:hypothetical protein
VNLTYQSELRELNELKYARLEAKLDRLIGELRGEMRAGFARLEPDFDARCVLQRVSLDSIFDGFERRTTNRLLLFSIAQAVTNAAIIIGMLKLLR